MLEKKKKRIYLVISPFCQYMQHLLFLKTAIFVLLERVKVNCKYAVFTANKSDVIEWEQTVGRTCCPLKIQYFHPLFLLLLVDF